MASLYSREHRALQERFGTTKLADFLDTSFVHDALTEMEQGFIGSRDMFFLSSVDPHGWPTVSYKGGPTGMVRVLDDRTLAFPGFDGNGMFLSTGNIEGQGKVGLLFIDFETPNRLRVQGTASLSTDDPLIGDFVEAQYVVRVAIDKIWGNCPRYIHRYTKDAQSSYVPRDGKVTPLAAWKRLDFVQEVIATEDKTRAEAEGILTMPDYVDKVMRGEG